MPTNNEDGYGLPPGLGDEIYSPFISGKPIFLTTSQLKQLDSLAADMAALRASVNQIAALLW